MEYISLAIPKETGDIVSTIEIKSNNYDLKLVHQTVENIDEEVRSGMLSLINCFNLLMFKIIKLSTSNKNSTSSDINQNLINFFLGKEKSNLIDFLTINRNILPQKYFIIFAFEWYEGELCRYKKIRINELSNYFIENNSWYLWLYDYTKNYEIPDLDIPLILEIDNEK